jgi:hypothetical protein
MEPAAMAPARVGIPAVRAAIVVEIPAAELVAMPGAAILAAAVPVAGIPAVREAAKVPAMGRMAAIPVKAVRAVSPVKVVSPAKAVNRVKAVSPEKAVNRGKVTLPMVESAALSVVRSVDSGMRSVAPWAARRAAPRGITARARATAEIEASEVYPHVKVAAERLPSNRSAVEISWMMPMPARDGGSFTGYLA